MEALPHDSRVRVGVMSSNGDNNEDDEVEDDEVESRKEGEQASKTSSRAEDVTFGSRALTNSEQKRRPIRK